MGIEIGRLYVAKVIPLSFGGYSFKWSRVSGRVKPGCEGRPVKACEICDTCGGGRCPGQDVTGGHGVTGNGHCHVTGTGDQHGVLETAIICYPPVLVDIQIG